MEPRRLKGHKATVTCSIASRHRPGIVVTAAEDGSVCWFDLRCKEVQLVMELGTDSVSSLCFKPGNEEILYVASGKDIRSFDVHMGLSSKAMESYSYNKDEINQIVCTSKSTFLAAGDDSGEIKIIDLNQKCLYKTLRSGHSSICSAVQFLPWKPWEVITGGLDSKLIMWDFSNGRPLKNIDFGPSDPEGSSNTSQFWNPAFVHSIAIPEIDMLEKSGKICAVARGDGVVDVINIESELSSVRSTPSFRPRKGSQPRLKDNSSSESTGCNGQTVHLDYSLGGHTAAVSCVGFSTFGEKGKFIISGGNDKSVKLWNWFKYLDQGQTSTDCNLLHLNIGLPNKVNWLCTTPTESENLVICDTTKVVKVYSVC